MFDLHVHSNNSDGKKTINEIAGLALEKKLTHFAIADHDSINGIQEMRELLKRSDTIFINAVELTGLFKTQEIHLLAYDFDPQKVGTLIGERNAIVEEKKKSELAKTMSLFKKSGFEVSDKLIVKPKMTVGLVVALDVYNRKSNQEKMQREFGKLLSEKEFFDQYQEYGQPCYVPRSGVTVDWLMKRFKPICGNIIIAHPFVPVSYVIKPLSEVDIRTLLQQGADGIEIYHNRTSEDQLRKLEKFVRNNNLYYTGGSDNHGKDTDTSLGYYDNNKIIPNFKLKNYSL